jgi:hypothetical protein
MQERMSAKCLELLGGFSDISWLGDEEIYTYGFLQLGKGKITSGVSFVEADNRIIFVKCILPNSTRKGRRLWEDAKYCIVDKQCVR